MGGHAVRYYGIDRKTFDFDFHLSAEDAPELAARLRRTRLFSGGLLTEAQSWRGADFQRFQIGVLPNGKEEWLEFPNPKVVSPARGKSTGSRDSRKRRSALRHDLLWRHEQLWRGFQREQGRERLCGLAQFQRQRPRR